MSDHVNILILSSQPNEAEGLITTLRNGGLAAHGTRIQDPRQIGEVASAQSCDLILCCTYDADIEVGQVLEHYQAARLDTPLVLVTNGPVPPQTMTQAMRSGARDLTDRDDAARLQWIVAREYRDLQARRALMQMRGELDRCQERLRDLVEASDEASAFIQQGIHLSTNQAYRSLFGFEQPEDLDGYPILDLVAPEHQAEVKTFLRRLEAGATAAPSSLDLVYQRTDGSLFDGELVATRAESDGEPCLRVTARVRAARRPAPGNPVDPEAGLADRTLFMERLAEKLGAGNGGQLALIVLRILGLERVAEVQGLSAALNLAAQVARSLQGAAGEGRLLARVTDSAYALALQPTTAAQAHAIADDLRQRTARVLQSSAKDATTTCMTGLALAGPGDRSGAVLLDQAFHDTEIQRVKGMPPDAGHPPKQGDKPPPHQPAARPTAPKTVTAGALPSKAAPAKSGETKSGTPEPTPEKMVALLNEALSGTGQAELRLVYQPIVSLMGDSQEHYSVLVRLLDADQHLHEAKEFMGAAAAGGLAIRLDRWVIQRAVAEIVSQRANDRKISFFINIAEQSLQDEGLLVWICDLLRELNARGSWLTFQFPEEEARRNLAALRPLVEGLKKIKCRIALTQCQQLEGPQMLMQSLPVDFLLCAQDLARGLAEDKAKQQQLNAFANLAQEFNVKSVVTGVEDAPTLTVLWTAKIDYVQGNFLQRPSPSLEINA